jgi:hypothetical protein
VEHEAAAAEQTGQEGGQRLGGLAKLGEDQHLLLLGGHGLDDLP